MKTISLFSTRLIETEKPLMIKDILFKRSNYSKSANKMLADYFDVKLDINNKRCVLYKLNDNFGENIFGVHIIEMYPDEKKGSWINFLVGMLRNELKNQEEEEIQVNLFLHGSDIKGHHEKFDEILYSQSNKKFNKELTSLCDGEQPKRTKLNVAFYHTTANDIIDMLVNDQQRDVNEEILAYIEENI